VPRLLGVGVEAVHEVVHDELQLLLARRGDGDLVALLQQPLVRIHDFEVFGRVAGQDQDLCHRETLASCVPACPSDPWLPQPFGQRDAATLWAGRVREARSAHQRAHQPGMTVPPARSAVIWNGDFVTLIV
jgi:hypothetical protein